MRVSPKYIIQLCQKGIKLHKRSHKYKEKGRRSIARIAGTLLVKGSRKKRTKKRQTQVKRQGNSKTSRLKLEIVETSRIKLGSVETSRLKLEIVKTSRTKLETVETSRKKLEINQAFSISDRENSQKGTTTTTSGTNRRKGNITKDRKEEEIRSEEKRRYDEYN